ncbi:MAG: 6-phosphofructokinase [Saprospiraceae bacterium]|jgi:phosphofructokinase-like protein
MSKKKLLVATGGGDCPGLNAVIRAIVKSADRNGEWEVYGSMEAFNGVLEDPPEIVHLDNDRVQGIHVKGGTIIKTTNKGNPLNYPIQKENGETEHIDLSDKLIERIYNMGFEAVINIGGDGSQKISKALFDKGLNIVGVPKTIDNDLSSTDLTFGFSTAVQIATDSFDKLVTTASSHNRVMILEVMGRNAGWIALHTAIAGGAELCLIPEVPFKLETIANVIESRYDEGKGFVNIVIAEGAQMDGKLVGRKEEGDENIKLGGVGNALRFALEDYGVKHDIRVAVLGHIQRGGSPIAFDRILASAFGVRAFELVRDGKYGHMVNYKNNLVSYTTLADATSSYNFVEVNNYLINTAKSIGLSFGVK